MPRRTRTCCMCCAACFGVLPLSMLGDTLCVLLLVLIVGLLLGIDCRGIWGTSTNSILPLGASHSQGKLLQAILECGPIYVFRFRLGTEVQRVVQAHGHLRELVSPLTVRIGATEFQKTHYMLN